MAKQEAEWSNSLSVRFLKKHGYLEGGWRSGGIKWTYGMSGNESSIGFTVNIGGDEGDNIRLQYTHTNRGTDEKESMDLKVGLTTTPCNYGGKRYWLICPNQKWKILRTAGGSAFQYWQMVRLQALRRDCLCRSNERWQVSW